MLDLDQFRILLYHSAFVHMLKHKFSELIHIVAAFLALTDLSPFFAGMNHIQYQRINPRPVIFSQMFDTISGKIFFPYHAGSHRIVDVVIYVCDSVADAHDTPFRCKGFLRSGMIQNPVPDFRGEIQSAASRHTLQNVYHPKTLNIVMKAVGMAHRQIFLSVVAERRMSQIVSQSDRFCQILVERQPPGDRPGNLRHIHGVSQTGPKMISLR